MTEYIVACFVLFSGHVVAGAVCPPFPCLPRGFPLRWAVGMSTVIGRDVERGKWKIVPRIEEEEMEGG